MNSYVLLTDAINKGKEEFIKDFIEDNLSDFNINKQRSDGKTLLMIASFRGFSRIVDFLLKHKADPNIQDEKGDTALIIASIYGHSKTVKTLLSHNADPRIVNNNNMNALMYVAKHNKPTKTRKNLTNIALMLLKNKKYPVDPNVQSLTGDTALICAIKPTFENLVNSNKNKNLNLIKLLLKYGSNIHIKNNKGENALSKAIEFGNKKILNFILKVMNNEAYHNIKIMSKKHIDYMIFEKHIKPFLY